MGYDVVQSLEELVPRLVNIQARSWHGRETSIWKWVGNWRQGLLKLASSPHSCPVPRLLAPEFFLQQRCRLLVSRAASVDLG